MGVFQVPTSLPSQVGLLPATKKMVSTDNLATVTAAGYLNSVDLQSNTVSPSDIIECLYSYNIQTNTGIFALFSVAIANGVITLSVIANPGDVLLPVVSGDFANFNGTTGQIKDAGFSPTDPTKTKIVMLNAAPTINHVAVFTNANGTIGDGGVLGTAAAKAASNNALASLASVSGATVTGNLLKAADIVGTVIDAGFALHAGTTAAFAGGGTTNTFTTTNMTAASIVTAVILASTNSVAITKALPGTNTLAITFSADPGAATTVSWISVTPAG